MLHKPRSYLDTAVQYLKDRHFPSAASTPASPSSTPTLARWRGCWYTFNGHGWRESQDEEIRRDLLTWMQERLESGESVTKNYLSTVMEHLATNAMTGIPGSVTMPVWNTPSSRKPAKNWIGFSNKIAVDIWSYAEGLPLKKCARPITPSLFSRDFVDYPFSPSSTACPLFRKYLKTSLPNMDTRRIFQEMMGLMLADTCVYETFFYLYGPTSRNGKTVALNILSALVGKQNVSHVNLYGLSERFALWPLAETKVNIYGDLPTDTGHGTLAQVEGVFKDLVSGASIECEKKGRDKYTAPCRARFVFAGNTLPTFVDRSDAIWERLRIVYFDTQIPENKRDPNLAEKIIRKEMPGVFLWAIEGLRRVMANRRVVESRRGMEVKAAHRLACNHEKTFLNEKGYGKGSRDDPPVKISSLYRQYREWMGENGYPAKGMGKFYAAVLSAIPTAVKTTARLAKDKLPERVFRGIKIMEVGK